MTLYCSERLMSDSCEYENEKNADSDDQQKYGRRYRITLTMGYYIPTYQSFLAT